MSEYLTENPPTPEQLNEWSDFFHGNGFLVIPNVLIPEHCQKLGEDLDRVLKKGKHMRSERWLRQQRSFGQPSAKNLVVDR